MNMNSSAIGPVPDPQPADASARVSQECARPNPATRPEFISGTGSEREISTPQSNSSVAEIAQDEVQVQRDSSDGEIVIRYLDRSGQVIVQIPSSQLLALARATEQALERQARARAGELHSGREGASSDGH